jgi:hypothetical protein
MHRSRREHGGSFDELVPNPRECLRILNNEKLEA